MNPLPPAPRGGAAPARVKLLLFASARDAAGTAREEIAGSTVGEVLDAARRRHGREFATILDGCRIWVNGEPATADDPLAEGDEVAVLPPVSGGCAAPARPRPPKTGAGQSRERPRVRVKVPRKPPKPRRQPKPQQPESGVRPAAACARGIAWACLIVAGVFGGPIALAAVVLPAGVVASASALRSRRRVRAPGALVLVPPLAASASIIAARVGSEGSALALISAVCLFDMARYIMGGSTRLTAAVGLVSGAASVAGLAFLLAAIADPPFGGSSAWVLCGLVVVLAPAGVVACDRLAGDRPNPAMRLLDSFVLAGPAWAIGAQVLLHHG